MANENKPKGSLAMLIARSHNLSTQFAGLQMSLAYMAALGLSAISVVIGLAAQIIGQFPQLPLYASIPGAGLVGVIAAFIFDGLTISSLKRIKSATGIWTRVFNFIWMAGGIFFSTLAGDQMWALLFPNSWKSWAFAVAISSVLLATELWHKEHEDAIKHASQRSDIISHAISQESVASLEDMQRETKFELFNDPTFKAEIRADIREVARNEISAQLRQQLRGTGHVDVKELQLSPPNTGPLQLPGPATNTQLQLPASGNSSATNPVQPEDRTAQPQLLPGNNSSATNTAPLEADTAQPEMQREAQSSAQRNQATKNASETPSQAASRPAQPRNKKPASVAPTRALQVVPSRNPARNMTAAKVAQTVARLQRNGRPVSATAVAQELGLTRQAVSKYPPFLKVVIEAEVEELESNQSEPATQSATQDKLDRAVELLSANADLTDEELAEELGMSRSGSARFLRLKAQDILEQRKEAVNE